MRKSILYILALFLCFSARAEEKVQASRLRFGVEWGYTQSFYKYHHFNIISTDGYRIDEESKGFFLHPNGILLASIGYDFNDRINMSLYSGYAGLMDNCRVFPLSLRLNIFPHRNMFKDGFFSFAEGGIGFRVPTLEKHSPAAFVCVGEAYRIKLTPYANLDFLLSLRMCMDRPLIESPEGSGYVQKHNIRSNAARYYALSFSIALNF